MGNERFEKLCIDVVRTYYNQNIAETVGEWISNDDIYIVWLCKILGNNKALISTTVPDTRYYEITYNGEKNEIYVDAYIKEKNYAVSLEPMTVGGKA